MNPEIATRSINTARFWSVIGATLFIMLGFGLIIPALPQFVRALGGGTASVATAYTAFAATRLFGNFFTTPLIERFGEPRMAAAGASIVGVSSIAAARAPSVPWLVVLRGLGGFGSAFFLGALTAYLVATIPATQRGRAMGIFQGSIGTGLLLGPLFGGLIIGHASVNLPFYLYGGVCLAFAPMALATMSRVSLAPGALADAGDLTEEHAPVPTRPSLQRLRPLLADSSYRAALAVSAATFVIVSAPGTLIPQYWTDVLGAAKSTSGTPFFVEALAGLVIIWNAGALSDRFGRKAVLVPAMGVSVVAAAAVGFTHSPGSLLLWIGVLGMASGYTRPGPTAIVADVAAPDARALAVSGYRIAGDVGSLLGPIITGILVKVSGFRAAWIGVAAFISIAFLITLASRETLPARVRA